MGLRQRGALFLLSGPQRTQLVGRLRLLQRRQLREQTYTDTQSTYLLVYAPGRRNALTLSLAEQLHRKFRLVDRLEGELTPSVNGVLLVSEDVECTSTALTYFAAALQQGADLVVCDAVFGYDGGSALYQTDQHLPGQRCALLSRALLDRCRAAARHRRRPRPPPRRAGGDPRGDRRRRRGDRRLPRQEVRRPALPGPEGYQQVFKGHRGL